MNIKNLDEPLLLQLARIIQTMRDAGKRPMRIHCTWGQLQALRTEMVARGAGDINPADMTILGIPLSLDPAGSGLWVSCVTMDELEGKKC